MKIELSFKSIIQNEMVQGMILPLLIYWVGGRFFSAYVLCLVTLTYSIAYVIFKALRDKKLNLFGVMTMFLSMISILGMVYFRTEQFVQYKGILMSTVVALVFFGSLFCEKCLLQQIVENSPNQFGPNFKQTALYKQIWREETLMWTAYNLSMAMLKITLMFTVSSTTYFGILYPISQVSFYALLGFSYYYPTMRMRNASAKKAVDMLY